VQGLWEEANRKASETFIAIANDEPIATEALGKAQSAAGGTSLDLTSIKAAITEKLGVKLPESGLGSDEAAQAAVQAGDAQAGLEVIAPDQISTIRDIATLIQKPISQTALTASVGYGVVILAGTVLAGPTRAATRVREFIAPGLRDPMWASFGTLLLLLVLIWWGPTPALHEALGIVLIAALVIAGVVALRRQTIREFPAADPASG
jgi:acyl carrier protein